MAKTTPQRERHAAAVSSGPRLSLVPAATGASVARLPTSAERQVQRAKEASAQFHRRMSSLFVEAMQLNIGHEVRAVVLAVEVEGVPSKFACVGVGADELERGLMLSARLQAHLVNELTKRERGDE